MTSKIRTMSIRRDKKNKKVDLEEETTIKVSIKNRNRLEAMKREYGYKKINDVVSILLGDLE